MNGSLFPWPYAGRAEEAIALEAFETPDWCARSIHHYELMTRGIVDPCCGHGTLSKAALARGYAVAPSDIADWGYGNAGIDFLGARIDRIAAQAKEDLLSFEICEARDLTVLMNPPFSKACQFVEHAWKQGVRKIVCFQRWPWYESAGRATFWDDNRPNRVYVCRERATCWRFDIPPEARVGSTPTSHAWYIWERNQPPGTLIGHLDRQPA